MPSRGRSAGASQIQKTFSLFGHFALSWSGNGLRITGVTLFQIGFMVRKLYSFCSLKSDSSNCFPAHPRPGRTSSCKKRHAFVRKAFLLQAGFLNPMLASFLLERGTWQVTNRLDEAYAKATRGMGTFVAPLWRNPAPSVQLGTVGLVWPLSFLSLVGAFSVPSESSTRRSR